MRKVYLEFVRDGSAKFYRVEFERDEMVAKITWGRIGTAGQSQFKPASEAEAKIQEKLNKGYQEVRNDGRKGFLKDPFPTRPGKKRTKQTETVNLDIWDELAALKAEGE